MFRLFSICLILVCMSGLLIQQGQASTETNKLDKNFEKGLAAYLVSDFSGALKAFNASAENNYPPAQTYLGDMHREGHGVTQDLWKAHEFYKRGVQQGHFLAESKLFWLWVRGIGTPEQSTNAHDGWAMRKAKYFHEAIEAKNGEPTALYFLARMHEEGWVPSLAGSDKTAYQMYLLSAEQGNANAQVRMGDYYYYEYSDQDVAQYNPKSAMSWYRKAAEQGHPRGQYMLGIGYGEGNGLPYDEKLEFKWHHLAAEQGYGLSAQRISISYLFGNDHTSQNVEIAAKLLKLAAFQGRKEAQDRLGAIYFSGEGNVSRDYRKALKWFRMAAKTETDAFDRGIPNAQYSLGLMYENGFGVNQNYDKALYWYNRVVKRGNWITTFMPSKVFELGKDIGLAAKSRVEKEIARRNRSSGLTTPQ